MTFQKLTLDEALSQISPSNKVAAAAARTRWNSVAKPLYSLGLLEEAICNMAGATGSAKVKLDKKALVIMCADNGVVEEGVSQVGNEVTAVVTENFTKCASSVAVMCRRSGVDMFPVDIGVAHDVSGEGLIINKLAYGTKNMTKEPAMTKAQAIEAIEFGINMVGKLKAEGYDIVATGEMGIGNTTTSAAILAVLQGHSVEKVTGKGSGLTSDGLERKVNAIKKAIEVNQPNPEDALDVLAKVGGLDIAGLAGVFIGGAVHKIPVLIDGVISSVAALVANHIAPLTAEYMLASHCSFEPAGRLALDELGVRAIIVADMCLGEGTGAIAVLPVMEMALTVYNEMSTFEEIEIVDYNDLVE